MKSKEQRTMMVESAISLLKDGINSENKSKIVSAYEILNTDQNFNWKDLEVLRMEWDELMEEALPIIKTIKTNDKN